MNTPLDLASSIVCIHHGLVDTKVKTYSVAFVSFNLWAVNERAKSVATKKGTHQKNPEIHDPCPSLYLFHTPHETS